MSKLLKYTKGFDNNPNSDIGASKRVVKEYKKLLAKEQLKPIIQEMNNQTKSVVTNLNDYSLLLKSITQNLVNADLYLSNPVVSNSKGAGRLIGGMPPKVTKKNKGTGSVPVQTPAKKNKDAPVQIPKFETNDEALAWIIKRGRVLDGENYSKGERNVIKKWGLLPNIGKATKSNTILKKLGVVEDKLVDDIPEEEQQQSNYEYPPSFYDEEYEFEHNSPKSPKIGVNFDQYMEGDRYSIQPEKGDIHGGDPQEEEEYEEEEQEEQENLPQVDLDWYGEDDDNKSFHSSIMGSETSDHSLGKYKGDLEDDNEYDGDGDIEVNLDDIIKNRKNTPIRENFIITLFSNIINQVHKASDFWETYITPNLSDIPKLKMDSFIKSNAVKNFEDAIIRFEDTLISGTIKTHLNYLDNIYHNLTRALDELFERMNIDIKRYSGGLSSSSDKPQLLGSGYLPFRASIYGSHLRDSNTKYLM